MEQKDDVIRARRYGNKGVGNYVIDKIVEQSPSMPTVFTAYAHPEYSGSRGVYMTFDAATVRVIRSYR